MTHLDPNRPILVYLANGVQGGAVVRAALRRGLRVRALVREPAHAAALAALGAELAAGDLADPASLVRASAGVDHAVLQVPIGPAEVMRGLAAHAVAAAKVCSLSSLVLKLASASRNAPCAEASFVGNAMVQAVVGAAGLPFAVVRPTFYLDNLLKPSARADLAERGIIALPVAPTQRIAWTSADDCAEAALALIERGRYGGDHRIAGPESVTGAELALRLTSALGRPVRYRTEPLDAFEREVDTALGAGTGRRVGAKFRYFAEHPSEADAILGRPFAPQDGLEGFVPTGIVEWARQRRAAFAAKSVDV